MPQAEACIRKSARQEAAGFNITEAPKNFQNGKRKSLAAVLDQ